MKNILVIAAHPDDEVIGCGGTLAKHASNGDKVSVIFLSDGEQSRETSTRNIAFRKKMAKESAICLGCQEPIFLGFPDNQLDTVPFLEIVKAIERVSIELQPDIIYTHHGGDLNIDHRLACLATMTAFRPQPNCSVQAIYAFETVSSTEWSHSSITEAFLPNRFHIIDEWLDIKRAALLCYKNELRPSPHSRSLENILNKASITGNSVGSNTAEAFVVLREIW